MTVKAKHLSQHLPPGGVRACLVRVLTRADHGLDPHAGRLLDDAGCKQTLSNPRLAFNQGHPPMAAPHGIQ